MKVTVIYGDVYSIADGLVSEFTGEQILANPLLGRHATMASIYHCTATHRHTRDLKQVYHLWNITGGDIENEFVRQGLIEVKPAITTLDLCEIPNRCCE